MSDQFVYLRGDRHHKLEARARSTEHASYVEKWREDLQQKFNHLTGKYGQEVPMVDENFVNRVKWRDMDLSTEK